MTVGTRPQTDADAGFLFDLYASTRDDLTALAAPSDQIRALILMQFNARNRHYAATFPNADARIILDNGEPIGRLLVDRSRPTIHLVDIAILPAFRRRGIGATLVQALLTEAAAARRTVTLHVLRAGAARSLYERLGFAATGGDDVYLEMTR